MNIERQILDANCNDCKFMFRLLDRYKQSLEFHRKTQHDEFVGMKQRKESDALAQRRIGNLDAYEDLSKEASKMKFQFDKSYASINYGVCCKFQKNVSFIPNTIQLETQECFEHRKK